MTTTTTTTTTTKEITMTTYRIDFTTSDDSATVQADYYQTGDTGFVTFKDDKHKHVASFNERTVRSVTAIQERATITGTSGTVGTVYVNVAPRIDEAAMSELVKQVADRVSRSARFAG